MASENHIKKISYSINSNHYNTNISYSKSFTLQQLCTYNENKNVNSQI